MALSAPAQAEAAADPLPHLERKCEGGDADACYDVGKGCALGNKSACDAAAERAAEKPAEPSKPAP